MTDRLTGASGYVGDGSNTWPAVNIAEGEVAEKAPQFAWLERFLGVSAAASSAATQQLLGWTPTHPTLVEDLDAGYYTRG